MSNRPWFKMYPSDFISGCMELTAEEKGVYATVLFLIYDRRTAIPNNPQWIARVCGCSTRRWGQMLTTLIEKGKLMVQDDGTIHSKRAKLQIESEEKEARKFAENGAKGGHKRVENMVIVNNINDIEEKGLQFHPSMPVPELDKKKERKITPYPLDDQQPLLPIMSQPEAATSDKQESAEDRSRSSGMVIQMSSQGVERLAVMTAWNTMAAETGLAKIVTMTGTRVRHLNARLKEHGIDGVLLAIKAIGESEFCCGKTGWRADFDWLLDATKFERAMNGGYANRSKPEQVSPITGQVMRRVHGAL